MKKTKSLLTLSLAFVTLCGCGNVTKADIKKEATTNNEIILNLTQVGLYNEVAGTLDQNTYIEYAKILTLDVGEVLPKDEITSSSKDVAFTTWCYTLPGIGIPQYTDTVIEGVTIYQAVFHSTVDVLEGSSQGGGPTNPDVGGGGSITDPIGTITYYFVDSSWWNADGALSYIYLFNSNGEKNATWPGEAMEKVSTDPETHKSTWKFDVDADKYTSFVIARVGPNGADWGAKTKDLTVSKDFNTITLTNTASWGDPGADTTLTKVDYE